MALSSIEKETIITFNEEEQQADIFTFNSTLRKRLAELKERFPNLVKLNSQDETDGQTSISYTIPKKFVKINPTRTRKFTDEQRAQLRENMMKFHIKKQGMPE